MFPPPPVASPEQRCLPDCAAIHRELKSRKNVTLQLLWEEYKQANPLGYAYSWYCELYREWQRQLDVVLRQEHRAGEKTFVDYAGQTVAGDGPEDGRGSSGAGVRRGAGRQQLHLRRSHLDAEPVGLDSLACAGLRVLRGHEPACHPGQPEVWREEALLLRAGVESHVWRSGDSLWRGHPSGAAVSSKGQGQGGGRGSDRSAVGAGGVAQAPVLQSGGVERGHPGAGSQAE